LVENGSAFIGISSLFFTAGEAFEVIGRGSSR